MTFSVTSLPNDPLVLKQTIQKQHTLLTQKDQQLKTQDATILSLQEQLRLLLYKRYGARSEQIHVDQLKLFNEAEVDVEVVGETDAKATIAVPAHRRAKPGRKLLPKDLPRIDCVHDLKAEEKVCPHDGTPLQCIGDAVSEQLDIIPATVQVIRHIRKKYACPQCEQHVVTAALPKQPIPKSQASPGALAFVTVSKYQDGLPLYRQQTIFDRLGMQLPRRRFLVTETTYGGGHQQSLCS